MFAKKMMWQVPNTGKTVTFKDLYLADPTLKTSIIQSFQLGIFKWYPTWYFQVKNNMTQWEALAVAMRIYLGKKLSETGLPWYKNYFTQAKNLKIIDSTEDIKNFNNNITREKLWIILYRISILKK